jgi:hypothetical protein
MKSKGTGFFWPSFTDLMTSMFFIMLVLYVLSYARLKIKVDDLDRKLKVYNLVEENLKPLKRDSTFFKYEVDYKRFTLAFNVKFKLGKSNLSNDELENFDVSINKIDEAGTKLKAVIDGLAIERGKRPELANVSYLLIIAGYASHLNDRGRFDDYRLSYNRSLSLWDRWKSIGIDFENEKYRGLVDLQISGNGWGGIGRFERDKENGLINEYKNQRFIIQVVPKIGDTQN